MNEKNCSTWLNSIDLSKKYEKGTKVVVYCYENEKDKAEKETRKMGYVPIDFVFIDNENHINLLIPKGYFTCAPRVKIQWAASFFTTTYARMML